MPSTIATNVNLNRQSVRRGRPRNSTRVDSSREYTLGGTNSCFASINTPDDFQRLQGSVDDLDLELGWATKEQMDNDPQCAAALSTRALGATTRPLEITPAKKALYNSESDEKDADDIAESCRRMFNALGTTDRDIRLTAFQLLRESMKIGHSKAEIVFARQKNGPDAGKEYIERIASKTRHNSCFVANRQGKVAGIAGFTGDYTQYRDPFALASVRGYLNAYDLGIGWELLPRDKWMVVTYSPTADDSPLGRSLFRAVYTAYCSKKNAYPMYLKALDNTAMPYLYVTAPDREYAQDQYPLDDYGVPDTTQEKVSSSSVLFDAVQKGRQGGITVGPYGTKAEYLQAASSGDPFMSAMGWFNSEITQGILLQALATGTDKHMARAAGQVHQDILDLAIRFDRATICDAIDRDLIANYVRRNWDERLWHLMPTCSFGQVELNDFAAWAAAFKNLADGGLILPSQFPAIWDIMGLPQGDLDELYEAQEWAELVKEQLIAPEVKADGTTGPSQQARYTTQESGKTATRKVAKRFVNRNAGIIS